MNLKVCLTFVLASIACGSQARDLQAIQQSGELKVAFRATMLRWRSTTKQANCAVTTWIWQRIWGRSWGLRSPLC